LITFEKGLTNFIDVVEVMPIKEIINYFIALANVDSGLGLKVSFSPRGDPDNDTKIAFAFIDGV
jgi:hypothetical protein